MKKIYGFTGLTGFVIILGAAGAADRNTLGLTTLLMATGALLMALAELGSRYGKRIGIGRKRARRGVHLSTQVVARTAVKYRDYAPCTANAGAIPTQKKCAATAKA